jgi:hypothetical protein
MSKYREYALKLIHQRYLDARISLFDVFPYGELLLNFSKECNHITEMILSPINNKLSFTWTMLYGLHQSKEKHKTIYGKDVDKKIVSLSKDKFHNELAYVMDLAIYSDIQFEMFRLKHKIKFEQTDMLFLYVDSRSSINDNEYKIHSDILENLNKYSQFINKYILIYDINFDKNLDFNLTSVKNDIGAKSASIEFLQNNLSIPWKLHNLLVQQTDKDKLFDILNTNLVNNTNNIWFIKNHDLDTLNDELNYINFLSKILKPKYAAIRKNDNDLDGLFIAVENLKLIKNEYEDKYLEFLQNNNTIVRKYYE